jgi:gamma-glutamylcyclotransferase (GGCT)/AIG2-like uncharacterized protein YtfP
MILIDKKCKICGKIFTVKYATKTPKYCSTCTKSRKLKVGERTQSISSLKEKAKTIFNRYIRYRDQLNDEYFTCLTCGMTKKIQKTNYHACHLFPAGHYPGLTFDEDNVHGGCISCNYFKHGVGHEYADKVRQKIGEERYEKLLMKKDYYKRVSWKWDKFYLQDVIDTYTKKLEELKRNAEKT